MTETSRHEELLYTAQCQGGLTEDGEEGEQTDDDGDGEENQDERVQLVRVVLLIQRVGGHRVVVIVKVPGRDGLLI